MTNRVPWAMMEYDNITQAGLIPQVKAHINDLPEEKREEYLKYLKSLCKFPQDFMGAS